jgi:hypothetical protein
MKKVKKTIENLKACLDLVSGRQPLGGAQLKKRAVLERAFMDNDGLELKNPAAECRKMEERSCGG